MAEICWFPSEQIGHVAEMKRQPLPQSHWLTPSRPAPSTLKTAFEMMLPHAPSVLPTMSRDQHPVTGLLHRHYADAHTDTSTIVPVLMSL